jgi:hypothetical protein
MFRRKTLQTDIHQNERADPDIGQHHQQTQLKLTFFPHHKKRFLKAERQQKMKSKEKGYLHTDNPLVLSMAENGC